MQDNFPIQIADEIWSYLSPFSAHQIELWGEKFPTIEHAYQWSKYESKEIQTEIKNSKSPLGAWRVSDTHRAEVRANFDKDAVMEELFRAKLSQHSDIVEILKCTGDRGILKIYPTDFYWGTGSDGTGANKMGKLWMKLRSELS
jgi:N-glycosidase YbiA